MQSLRWRHGTGMSFATALGADQAIRSAPTNEGFVSAPGSPHTSRSASFNSAKSQDRSMRTAGSFTTARSEQVGELPLIPLGFSQGLCAPLTLLSSPDRVL